MKTGKSFLSVNNKTSDDLIIVGRIVAPHGVRGDLRILPDTDRPAIFKRLKTVVIGGKAYEKVSARPHKRIWIFHLKGVEDRNMAETMTGQTVSVPFSELPPRPKGTYYYFQLIGLHVVTDEGEPVGTITEIEETGANNVYIVKTEEGKEIALPAIPSCILRVDLEKHEMIVHMLEWE